MLFTPDDVQARLRDRSFLPVQIVLTTGQTYDIYHPDLVLVGRRYLIVGTPSSENPSQFDLVTRVPLVHVAELRDLPVTSPPTNGPAA